MYKEYTQKMKRKENYFDFGEMNLKNSKLHFAHGNFRSNKIKSRKLKKETPRNKFDEITKFKVNLEIKIENGS